MKRTLMQAQKDRISAHDYRIEGPLTHPYESIQMGNGDVGASVNIYTHEVKLTLGKSDVWDAKYDGRAEETVLTHDDLLQMMREKQRDLEPGQDYLIHSKYYNFSFRGNENHGPYPKRAGAVRVYHPGLSNTKVSSRLSLLTGLLETRFGFPKGELVLKAFIEQGHNRLWLTVEGTGELPWVALIVEKEPDDVDRSIPFPDIGFGNSHTGILTQTIPGGFDVDPFTWSLAGGFPQKEEGIDVHALELHAYRCRHYCAVQEGKRAILCVGLATSREAGDTVQAAMALTEHRTQADYERAWQSHAEAWEEFWLRSNVSLSDKALESVWYRNHFGYGCAMKEGILPPGIGGNVSVADSLPWRGDHHLNHNFQKWFVTSFPTNHPEWIELYADFIQARMDTFEYLAKLIFGLEGAYCELLYFPYTKKEHCNIHNYMGRALALTGWAAQPLWWHYEYMRDADWLRRRAYPYLRKAAQFYYNYMEKYMDESGDIYPSTRIEEPGWKKDFKGSRNVISDLVMFKKCFEWAIAASEILGEDEAWREKWRSGLERVPPLGYGWENGEGYVEMDEDLYAQPDGQRADAVRTSRWAGGGWAVFPGEYLDGDEENALADVFRDMMRRTDLLNPFTDQSGHNKYPGTPIIHPISCIVPTLRLGVLEQFENVRKVVLNHRMTYGQASSYMLTGDALPREIFSFNGFLWYDWRSVENKYLGVIAVTEMLLQSQGGVIRLFPYCPEDMDASFEGMRARGGFVIDANRQGGKVQCRIVSQAGCPCRIRWAGEPSRVTCEGRVVACTWGDRFIEFPTQAGCAYVLEG